MYFVLQITWLLYVRVEHFNLKSPWYQREHKNRDTECQKRTWWLKKPQMALIDWRGYNLRNEMTLEWGVKIFRLWLEYSIGKDLSKVCLIYTAHSFSVQQVPAQTQHPTPLLTPTPSHPPQISACVSDMMLTRNDLMIVISPNGCLCISGLLLNETFWM